MKQCLIDKITNLLQNVPIVANLARKKFVAQFVIASIKSKNVQFCEIAQHLNDKVKVASNETRIQDFFRETDINFSAVAILLISLLPKKQKLRLCIDRTEWNFGSCEVNILMILVGYKDVQIPLYWELLDNRSGNSNANDRIDLLNLCLTVIEKERIGVIIGDREFIGHKWLKYLKDNSINFIMRMPKHHLVTNPDGHQRLVNELTYSQDQEILLADCQVDGVFGHVWVKPLKNGDHLFLFGRVMPKLMGQIYRKRWSIESCFQNLKGRGFNLSLTHLTCLKKLKKLVALVAISYSFCVSIGVYFHNKVQPVKTKKHGYKATSFSRHGLNQLRQMSRDQAQVSPALVLKVQSLFRWLTIQLTHYQHLKIVG